LPVQGDATQAAPAANAKAPATPEGKKKP